MCAAKQLGHEEIRVHIFEFIPSKKSIENLIYREKAAFEDHTGLPYAIELTESGQYSRLTDQISKHHAFLESQAPGSISIKTAARDGYQTIYCPLAAIIGKGDLLDHFPRRTLADLYTYVSYHLGATVVIRTGTLLKFGKIC